MGEHQQFFVFLDSNNELENDYRQIEWRDAN